MNENNRLLLTLNYVFPLWVSLYTLFLSDKKDDPTCRFHGWQSLYLGIVIYVTSFLFCLGIIPGIYSLYYAYKIYTTGEEMVIPKLTDMAREQANK
ncbi:MAG: hypothetical protein ABRQ38_08195 [Candidatus Eremiobacterota bacterium]